MPNPKKAVRYDELIQLLVDNGFKKDSGSYLSEIWVNSNNKEFIISPDQVFIPYDAVELALLKAGISSTQLGFYEMRYFKSRGDSE